MPAAAPLLQVIHHPFYTVFHQCYIPVQEKTKAKEYDLCELGVLSKAGGLKSLNRKGAKDAKIFIRIGCAGKELPAVDSNKDAMPAAALLFQVTVLGTFVQSVHSVCSPVIG